MSNDLDLLIHVLPCPFCGCKNIACIIIEDVKGYQAVCNECSAQGPFMHTRALAREWWNERYPDPSQMA